MGPPIPNFLNFDSEPTVIENRMLIVLLNPANIIMDINTPKAEFSIIFLKELNKSVIGISEVVEFRIRTKLPMSNIERKVVIR